MLKKTLIVVAALLMVSPAFGAWSDNQLGPVELQKDDDGNIIGWKEGYSLPSDRTVDWQRDDKKWQRKAEVWNWPASYDEVPIARLTVKMEVGFWIRLDCDSNELLLKQVKIDTYEGQTKCTAKANVDTVWSASYAMKSGVTLGGKNEAKVDPPTLAKTTGTTVYVKLKLYEVNLQDMTPGNGCQEVGTVTVKVKPAVRPNLFMSGCDASGAKFGQPTYQYYAPPKP